MPDFSTLQDDRAQMGSGWSFPIRVNLQGSLQLSSTERNIEESIWLILQTPVGERASRPDFGSRLEELAFAPMNSDTLILLCVAVEEALTLWEPRIDLDEVRADPDPVRGRVDLVIDYHLTDTYQPRSLVYPFYLQTEELDVDAEARREAEGVRAEKTLDDW